MACACGQLAAINNQLNTAHSQLGAQQNSPFFGINRQGFGSWLPSFKHWMEVSELTDIEMVAEHLNE